MLLNMKRILEETIKKRIQNDKIVIIIGQRQVGKTYLLRRIERQFKNMFENILYFDFQDIDYRDLFTASVSKLKSVIGKENAKALILMDEIQLLPDSGAVMKLIHDHFPSVRIVATGSASYLLLKNIGDSLYGRNIVLSMFPLTIREAIGEAENFSYDFDNYPKLGNKPNIDVEVAKGMIYGTLPAVFLAKSVTEKEELLRGYVDSLLFKDIFEIEGIRDAAKFKKLLTLLALQLGSEINPNELATQLGLSRNTVIEHINLFEKFQIIYTLKSFSNNPRKEISKGMKVYFVDLGIRNCLINNFATSLRPDIGSLFENFVINTIRQNIQYYLQGYSLNYWRSYNQYEVDLVIHSNKNHKVIPVEIKFSKLVKPTKSFTNEYRGMIDRPLSICKDTFWQYI